MQHSPAMTPEAVNEAATILWRHWSETTRIDALPAPCRPANRADGYAIQTALARVAGQRTFGWKIAATSVAGQKHIAVDGPLAGRLLAGRIVPVGQPVTLGDNLMRVAEAEFAFRMRTPLPARDRPYTVDEVLAAVDTLHPAIEIPDSRYRDFTVVGAPQLIADMACACWFVLGPATNAPWRERDLAGHSLTAKRNGEFVSEGRGANALGDPRIALAWIANELTAHGEHLRAGDVVTTGTCVVPFAIAPGDRIEVDYGEIGRIGVAVA
jgi:2-keto-4-pentenoate hydratase